MAGLSLDRSQLLVSGEYGTATLTPTEFRLLEYLMGGSGVVINGEELLQEIWGLGPGVGRTDVLRSHMRNLRGKIRTITRNPDVIRTLPRRGYRFAA